MSIRFDVGNGSGNRFSFKNRRAAYRQTQAERNNVYAKYQALVGTLFKNSMAARRAADAELRDPKQHPEYWDNDQVPRLPLRNTSTCVDALVPAAGGVFIYFKSNPSKGYFYPSAGTTEGTAERIGELLTSTSIGESLNGGWGAQNGAARKYSKSGKSYSYVGSGGKSLDFKKFNAMGARLRK